MKICILSIVNIKHMSLISLYTSYFEKNGIEYDIIYIDKYDEEEYTTAKSIYRYPIKISREWNNIKKLFVYWRFKKYAQNIINTNKYDYIIVWRTETAFMFADYLSRKMKGKYCVNVRDYCMEKNPLVFFRVKKAIKNATFTTISSDGFKSFLPKHEYITVHSFNEGLLEKCKPKDRLREYFEPIRICFIGYIRFFDIDKKLIDVLGNDSRYIIQFFGEGSQYLEKYVKDNKINNVEFNNGFQLEETPKFLEKADVINNLYGQNNIALDTAVSTKYYYALHMNIPILVFKGTYMEEISCRSGIGFAVDEDFTSLADDFYKWYHSIDYEEFKKRCKREILNIKIVNDVFTKRLDATFLKLG